MDDAEEIKKPASWYGVRFTQTLLLFFLLTLAYGMRTTLSVGIVAMTDSSVNSDFPVYDWTDKSIILSSFYWGYLIPQIISGQLAERVGPKWILFGSMLGASLASLLIPVVARFGSWAVMLCRAGQGFFQAPCFPSIQYLMSKWAPPSERSRIGSVILAGVTLGTAFCNAIAGYIVASSLGYPFLFYFFAGLGVIWTIAWIFLAANTPDEHKSISEEERTYIKRSLGQIEKAEAVPTPWIDIITSLPFLAVLVSHSVENWGFVTLLTEIPSYMNYVLGFDIESNGLLSASLYIVRAITGFIFGYMVDLAINKRLVSLTIGRKCANTVGFIIPAIILICLGALEPNKVVAVVYLFLTLGTNAAIVSGFQVNHIDLSPRFSGTQMGITNTFATVTSILGPLSVQYIVTDETNVQQWAIVFYLSAAIYIFGAMFFIIFGSAKTQPWNEGSKKYREKLPTTTTEATKETKS